MYVRRGYVCQLALREHLLAGGCIVMTAQPYDKVILIGWLKAFSFCFSTAPADFCSLSTASSGLGCLFMLLVQVWEASLDILALLGFSAANI